MSCGLVVSALDFQSLFDSQQTTTCYMKVVCASGLNVAVALLVYV